MAIKQNKKSLKLEDFVYIINHFLKTSFPLLA
jgi:hypothetical protein